MTLKSCAGDISASLAVTASIPLIPAAAICCAAAEAGAAPRGESYPMGTAAAPLVEGSVRSVFFPPPPPPAPESSAKSTRSVRPLYSRPFRLRFALSAVARSMNSQNPKPLSLPVSRSVTSLTRGVRRRRGKDSTGQSEGARADFFFSCPSWDTHRHLTGDSMFRDDQACAIAPCAKIGIERSPWLNTRASARSQESDQQEAVLCLKKGVGYF